jgi:predicted RNase H-like HicB family nuclease
VRRAAGTARVACYPCSMQLTVQVERETDGRWIAAVDPIGALAYGRTRAEAVRRAKAVALEVLADRLAHGESPLTGRKTRRTTAFEGVRFVA